MSVSRRDLDVHKNTEGKLKGQTPAIRFKGFESGWAQEELKNLARFSKGMGYSKSDLKRTGTPIILYGRLYTKYETVITDVDTFVDAKAGAVYSYGGEVIVPASGETAEDIAIASVVERAGILLGGDLNIITPQEKIDSTFLAISISNGMPHDDMAKMAQGKSVVHLHNVDLERINLCYPCYEEQKSISRLFCEIDTLLTLTQRKHDKLADMKKAMLEKMFPREGRDVPEIRFAGFRGPWERRRLGDVVFSFSDPVPTPHDGYERLGIRSHGKGTFCSYVEAGHELETDQMYKVAANNLIVNITFAWEHAVAVTSKADEGKLVSHRFPQFSLGESMVPQFLKYLILDDRFRHHLWLASPGGAGRNRVLKIDEMLDYLISMPNVDEQLKISLCLDELNALLTLTQRKLDKLRGLKKAMLEKMFV